MSKKEDGGPAFPGKALIGSYNNQGMSLRDWFAGQAIPDLIHRYQPPGVAKKAY